MQLPISTIFEAIFISSQICKMTLVVRPVEHADVAQCIALRVANLGSLVIGRPPPYPGYVEDAEATVHDDLNGSTRVHHLKVIDSEDEGTVIAYAKWEIYPHGRHDLDKLRKPMDPADKEVDEYGLLREAAHNYFCSRNGEMGKHPHIRKLFTRKNSVTSACSKFPLANTLCQ